VGWKGRDAVGKYTEGRITWGTFLSFCKEYSLLFLEQMRWYTKKHFGIVKGYADVR
jgi:hypothetical protein